MEGKEPTYWKWKTTTNTYKAAYQRIYSIRILNIQPRKMLTKIKDNKIWPFPTNPNARSRVLTKQTIDVTRTRNRTFSRSSSAHEPEKKKDKR